jgi:hypothetical protein
VSKFQPMKDGVARLNRDSETTQNGDLTLFVYDEHTIHRHAPLVRFMGEVVWDGQLDDVPDGEFCVDDLLMCGAARVMDKLRHQFDNICFQDAFTRAQRDAKKENP